jgi:hypothetical protein
VSRGIGLVFLVLLVGLVVGGFLGELLGSLLPAGFWHDLVNRGPSVGLTSPATLDLGFLSVTLGLVVRLNLIAVIGIAVAALLLRKL